MCVQPRKAVGLMDDAEGREIDFRNTVIILTSNAGSQGIMQACFKHDEDAGGTVMKSNGELPAADELAEALRHHGAPPQAVREQPIRWVRKPPRTSQKAEV
jgi:hypothetical protein